MNDRALSTALQEVEQHLLKLLSDLSALQALAHINLRETDEPGFLRTCMRILMENSDIEACSIFLLEGNLLVSAGDMDWSDILVPGKRKTATHPPRQLRIGEGLVGVTAETGTLQHCRNTRHDPLFAQAVDCTAAGSIIGIPLSARHRILGVLTVSHSRPHHFNNSHERLVLLYCAVLTQMFSNLRYMHHMEREVQERTQELESALAETETLKRRYQELSMIDELTSIHNRRHFFPAASAALVNALRQRLPFALIMIDLDRFKEINDAHGHATGDKVLQVAAALLKGQTREGDVIARFGGEEFVMALPNTDMEGATRLSERLLESLRGVSFSEGGKNIHVTASIGISCLKGTESPDRDDLLETLVGEADRALYHGKHHGRDQVRSFSELASG
jgi:diguanylate cyclase (GGDEF)-like protein